MFRAKRVCNLERCNAIQAAPMGTRAFGVGTRASYAEVSMMCMFKLFLSTLSKTSVSECFYRRRISFSLHQIQLLETAFLRRLL